MKTVTIYFKSKEEEAAVFNDVLSVVFDEMGLFVKFIRKGGRTAYLPIDSYKLIFVDDDENKDDNSNQ